MAIDFTYADRLYDYLKGIQEVFIYPIFGSIEFDVSTGESFEIKEDSFGNIHFTPSKKELTLIFNGLIKEVRSNKYQHDIDLNLYAKKLYSAFYQLNNEFYDWEKDNESYILRTDIKIYYDLQHKEFKTDSLLNFNELPKTVKNTISQHYIFQKNIIEQVLEYIKQYIPDEDNIVDASIVEVQDDCLSLGESDTRINLGIEPEVIRSFFSFLKHDTAEGRIISDEDFEYFLNRNFFGFPINQDNRTLSFLVIKNVDFIFIIFKFYKKFGGLKSYNRTIWAHLLHDSFPLQFTGMLETTVSNLKKNNSTVQKLVSLNISHPF